MTPELAAAFFIFSLIASYTQHAEEVDGEGSGTSEGGSERRRRGADMEVLMLGGGLEGLKNLTEFKAAVDAVGANGGLEDLTEFESALDAVDELKGDCLKRALCGLATKR